MANIEVGSAFVSIYPDTSKLSSGIQKSIGGVNFTSLGTKAGGMLGGGIAAKVATAITGIPFTSLGTSGGNSFGKAFTGVMNTLSVTAGNLLSGGISTAINTAMSGISSGIRRSDILRNFPRVMTSLGYASEEANASVQKMMDHLLGLPTATQDMAKFVQQLTASTGNLDKSTKVGLAFNDMALAAGASTGDAANAMMMFNRMLSNGTFDARRWQAINVAMPGQLRQLSEALLGAGASYTDLGNALQDGTVTFDQLMDKMIEMDEVSTDTFTNFHDQAFAATGGIGTALTNMATRIGAGWQYVIDLFGNENIASVITAFGNGIRDSIKAFGGALDIYLDPEDFKTFAENTKQGFADAIEGFKLFVHSPYWATIVNTFTTITDAAHAFAEGIASALSNGYVGEKLESLGNTFINVGRTFRDFIKGIDFSAIGKNVGGVVDRVVQVFDNIAGIYANSFLNTFDFSHIESAIGSVADAFKKLEPTMEVVAGYAGENLALAIEFLCGIVEGFMNVLGEAGPTIEVLYENLNYLMTVIAPLGELVGNILGHAFETLLIVFNNIVAVLAIVIDGFVHLPETWEAIKAAARNIWNSIKTFIINTAVSLVTNAVKKFNELKTNIENIWNSITTTVHNVWDGIKNFISNTWTNIKTTISNIIQNIKTTIGNVFNSIRTTVSNIVTSIKNTVSTVFNNIRTIASNVWNGVKTTISNAVTGARNTVTNVFNAVRNTVSNVFNGIRNTASSVWNGISSTISGAINSAKWAVSSAIDAIKGFFNFTFRWPHIPLPHFSIKPAGWKVQDLLTGKIPSLGIEWYAKGGIVDGATLIGAGEAGAEAIIPLTNRQYVRPFAAAIASELDTNKNTGGVTVTGNTFYVREEKDISEIAYELNNLITRQTAGAL